MPIELTSAIVVFILLVGSAALGIFVRPRLPERHRTRETTELMQVTISLLVTFAALVLGLLTASVKQSYDLADHDRRAYAEQLALLDGCLREYGSPTDAARMDLRAYTAAVIASTWPDETPPRGVAYPDASKMARTGSVPELARLMNRIGLQIVQLDPQDAVHQRILSLCISRFTNVQEARLDVVVDAERGLFNPFYQILVGWLMVIFACFGLAAPPNGVSAVTTLLCALSLSSVIFVILDLGQPYGGLFSIASVTMREALASMMSPS
jgi:hypothetical protein